MKPLTKAARIAQADLFWGDAVLLPRPDSHLLLPLMARRGAQTLQVAAFAFSPDVSWGPVTSQPILEEMAEARLFRIPPKKELREVDYLKDAVDFQFKRVGHET